MYTAALLFGELMLEGSKIENLQDIGLWIIVADRKDLLFPHILFNDTFP